jgi:hypothetical protein
MQSNEIPTHQWVPFLDDFSRRHEGELVTIELLGQDVGDQPSARAVPLVGVCVDLVEGGRNEQIEVMVGQEPRSHLMHAIPRPRHVRVARGDDGREVALQIESRDGPTTLVHLGQSARTAQTPV